MRLLWHREWRSSFPSPKAYGKPMVRRSQGAVVHGPCEDGDSYWIPAGHEGDAEPNCYSVRFEDGKPPEE